MKYQKQKHKLEALVRDLECELSEGNKQVEVIEETQKRLLEAERICQELAEENRQLREEITGWKERLAKSEEDQGQVSILRQQLEALQAEHARVIDGNRQLQEKLAASSEAGRVSLAREDDSPDARSLQSKIPTVARLTPDFITSDKAGGHLPVPSDSAAKTHVEANAGQITYGWIVRNWRVGAVIGALVILVIAASVIIKQILMTEVPSSNDPMVFTPEATSVERVPEPVSQPSIQRVPRVRGAFRTVRPTQVFSGPSEDSALVANIGEGTKVNVVDSRDGWLEVRSKHGRPPGFIREDAAVKIGSN